MKDIIESVFNTSFAFLVIIFGFLIVNCFLLICFTDFHKLKFSLKHGVEVVLKEEPKIGVHKYYTYKGIEFEEAVCYVNNLPMLYSKHAFFEDGQYYSTEFVVFNIESENGILTYHYKPIEKYEKK